MFTIEFLPNKRAVVCKLEGNINRDDLLEPILSLINDERYKDDYHCIWDIRNVPDSSNFQAESKEYAKIIASFRKERKGKLVIIAHDAKSSPAFAKFYVEMAQEGIQLDLHKNLEEAFIWLNSLN
jgi:hypothetical protein